MFRYILTGIVILCSPVFGEELPGEGTQETNRIGFYSGKVFIEASQGRSFLISGSFVDSLNEHNASTIPLWSNLFSAGVYSYSQSQENRPRISSMDSYRIQMGTGLTNSIAIVSGIDVRTYTAHGYSRTGINSSLFMYLIRNRISNWNQAALAADSLNINYLLMQDRVPVLAVLSGDVGIGYHFRPNERLDFYIQGGMGQGLEYIDESRVDKAYLSGGANIYINKFFYLNPSLEHSILKIKRSNDGYILFRKPPQGILHDSRLTIGAGFGFSHLPDLPELRLFRMSQSKESDYINIYRSLRRNPDVELRVRENHLTVIFLENAIFPSGSINLIPAGKKAIERVARILAGGKDIRFTIEGHTDSVPVKSGSSLYDNQVLSEMRAVNVMRIFESLGISEEKLNYKGYADRMPRKSNSTPAGRFTNRRIEIVLDGDISGIDELKGIPPW